MQEDLRKKIYSHFDKNGITGEHKGLIRITFDIEENKRDPNEYLDVFVPYLIDFKLSQIELEDLIIDYIFHTTNVRINSVNDIMNMREIEGKPFILNVTSVAKNNLESPKIKYCLAFGSIPGSVTFRNEDKIYTLGNIEEIKGDLGFSDSKVEDLGKLKRVEGSLWIAQSGDGPFTKLKSLQELEYVGGDLNIKNSDIEDLGKLKYVGGNLNLRQTFIIDIRKVEYIGGNLLLPKELNGIINLSKTKILGKVKYFDDRSLKFIL